MPVSNESSPSLFSPGNRRKTSLNTWPETGTSGSECEQQVERRHQTGNNKYIVGMGSRCTAHMGEHMIGAVVIRVATSRPSPPVRKSSQSSEAVELPGRRAGSKVSHGGEITRAVGVVLILSLGRLDAFCCVMQSNCKN